MSRRTPEVVAYNGMVEDRLPSGDMPDNILDKRATHVYFSLVQVGILPSEAQRIKDATLEQVRRDRMEFLEITRSVDTNEGQ